MSAKQQPQMQTKSATNAKTSQTLCSFCCGIYKPTRGSSIGLLTNACKAHMSLVTDLTSKLLGVFGGNFAELVSTLIQVGSHDRLFSPKSLEEIIKKRLRWDLPSLTKPRFNSTQALKRYCREQYKKHPSRMITKPPKNSCSKSDFVRWAHLNKVNISHFKTRSYQRKNFPALIPTPASTSLVSSPLVASNANRTTTTAAPTSGRLRAPSNGGFFYPVVPRYTTAPMRLATPPQLAVATQAQLKKTNSTATGSTKASSSTSSSTATSVAVKGSSSRSNTNNGTTKIPMRSQRTPPSKTTKKSTPLNHVITLTPVQQQYLQLQRLRAISQQITANRLATHPQLAAYQQQLAQLQHRNLQRVIANNALRSMANVVQPNPVQMPLQQLQSISRRQQSTSTTTSTNRPSSVQTSPTSKQVDDEVNSTPPQSPTGQRVTRSVTSKVEEDVIQTLGKLGSSKK